MRRRGGWAGAGPGRGPPTAAWRIDAVLDPFPVPGRSSLFTFLQVAYHWWASRVAVCVHRPGDAHALWRRVVGVLRSVPVAGCVRVSGSVGRL